MEINSNHIDLNKLNRILWIITGENRELIQTLEKEDKIGEIRLIRDIKNTLKICKFSIPNQWMEVEIYQVRLKLLEHLKVDIDLHTKEDHVLLGESNPRDI